MLIALIAVFRINIYWEYLQYYSMIIKNTQDILLGCTKTDIKEYVEPISLSIWGQYFEHQEIAYSCIYLFLSHLELWDKIRLLKKKMILDFRFCLGLLTNSFLINFIKYISSGIAYNMMYYD